MVSSRDFDTMVIVLVFLVLGLVTSMILWTLNDRGVLIDELVSGSISITDLQIVVIILWGMVGIIVAAVKK